jgi:hypothetical protein
MSSVNDNITLLSLRDHLAILRHMRTMTEVRLQSDAPFPREYPACGVNRKQVFMCREQMQGTLDGLDVAIEKIWKRISDLDPAQV